ncbi:MAG: ABC transporter substrate-binding protein, partial [Nostoc sp.]
MIVNCRRLGTGRQKSGILPIVALLMLSMTTGCSQSNPNQGKTSEQSPQAQEVASIPRVQSGKTKVVTTFLPIYLFTKAV